jgi:hypothetical protein
MHKLTGAGSAAAAALLVTLSSAGAGASASAGVLDLEMNEASGATTAVDSSGAHHDGVIGSLVRMGGGYAHFPLQARDASLGTAPLIEVPDAPGGSLDPGSGDFTIDLRYRTTHAFGNLLQKGQATTSGGQVKLQQPKGKLSCMFKTAQGTATAGSGSVIMNDGAWHTVQCVRTPSSVTMFVDGRQTGQSNHTTGTLDNSMPWTIGGKARCNGITVTCDYFAGDVDYLRLTQG